MRGEQLLSRLVMAVTLAVASLILAPSGAQAHAGHSHVVPAATVMEPGVEPTTNGLVTNVAPTTMQVEVTLRRASGESASLVPTHGSKTPQSCPGGCCHSAGTGCCAVSVPPILQLVVPVIRRSTFVAAVVGGAGITLGALPEPPRSLV
jgi:hypothetical protein